MSNQTLSNGFSDLEVPVCDGGTNDTSTLALTYNGVDQGAKGTIETLGDAGALTAWARVNDASRADTFRLQPTSSGYKALPVELTIDGVTVQPAIRLEGEDADLTAWTDTVNSNAFAIAGTGADPTFDENTPGIDCKRVKFNAAKYYQSSSASVGDITTEDIVFEMIWNQGSVSKAPVTKTAGTNGWGTFISGSTSIIFSLFVGGAATSVTATGIVPGSWNHMLVFIDRSLASASGGTMYVNGVANGTADFSSKAASISTADALTLGARSSGALATDSGVSYCAMWKRQNWLVFSSYAGIAAKRFAQCCGVYAGTAQQLNPGFADLDMEAAGTTSWTAANGATLSKQAAARTGGSGSQVLRVLGNGSTASAAARQTKSGGLVRITGWARSDGTATPAINMFGNVLWTGTTSTDWQYFDEVVKSYNYPLGRLDMGPSGVTAGYVEFDDVTIEANGAIPTVQSRTTVAHLEKWNTAGTESYLIPVGAGWMRTDKIKCADDSFKTGVRIERAQTNRLLYSEDFSDANWTKTRVTIGTPVVALGVISFDAIIASVDSATHLVTQGITTAASESHSFSIHAKAGPGTTNSIRIELDEDKTQYAYYNLATGEIGATGAGFTLSEPVHIYDKGNGYYRCEFRPTTAGITGTINIYASNGSTGGGETFAGDASTPSVYLGGAQFERSPTGYQAGSLTSYLKTTSATVGRVADTLTFHGYENCGSKDTKNITAKVDYVCPVFVAGYSGYRVFLSLSGKSSGNRAEIFRDVAVNKLLALISVGGASQALLQSASQVNFSNNEQTVEVCYAKDNVNIVLNRTKDATDTSADLPEILEIVVGSSYGYAFNLDGLITDFMLSPYGTVYPRAILALEKDSHTQSAFIGYDTLDADALTYELRAGAGTTRGVTLNGGTLNADTWHLIGLQWSGGTGISLRIDGAEVDTSVADATIAGLTDLLIAWAGLKGYAYEPAGGALSYPITFGAVSIADVQLHGAVLPAAWYTEMVARGVPAKNEHLIHQISQVADLAATHYDLLTGAAGTLTDEGANDFVPPTEVGLALGANTTNNTIIDFGSGFAFMQSTSHSYDAWIRVDGSGDQCLWANGDENGTDFQGLLYDDATDSLVYTCVIGATVRSVSAAIELDRLYHVAVTRAYSSGAGTTTLTIYIDSVPIESQVYTGAPVITNDAFVMLSTSEAAGVFTLPFIGATVGNRFYDDALTLAEIEAIYDADSLVMVNGPYATQAITAATLPATISGAVKPDGTNGYPIVLVQDEVAGEWRAIASAESASSWSTFEKAAPVNAIRLYAKSYDTYTQSAAYFDDLDGGTDPGDSTIGLVEIAKNKRKALENIVLMRKPLHSWAVMVVRYV